MCINTRQMFLAVAIAGLGAGCADTALVHPDIVRSRDEAAGVLLSVNGTIPWTQVSDTLQPRFAMANGTAAVAEVAPVTARLQSRATDAFGVNVGVGRPGTTTPTPPSSPNPSAPPPLPAGDTTFAFDPLLKYQAALALFQAVQLMNQTVQAAPLRDCYVPYLVQLKLAVMPYRRHLPYDLHARISFFQEPAADRPKPPDTPKAMDHPICRAGTDEPPQVVPILVTDDIERALTSRSVDVARQIGLALSFMAEGVGGSIGANKLAESLNAISATDINSQLTVTRQSNNTLYVRIGASNEGTAGLALIGQTHDISLLLLVPKGYFKAKHAADEGPVIQVVSFTEFRNARDGSVLSERNDERLLKAEDEAIEGFLTRIGDTVGAAAWQQRTPDDRKRVATKLIRDIKWSDDGSFFKDACANLFKAFSCESVAALELSKSLWTRLSTIQTDSAYQSAFFTLRRPANVVIPDQAATMLDDGAIARIVLQDVVGANDYSIRARLVLNKAGKSYPLAAENTELDTTTRRLTLTFPSPRKWGISSASTALLQIEPRGCPDVGEEVCPASASIPEKIAVSVATTPPAKPAPAPKPKQANTVKEHPNAN